MAGGVTEVISAGLVTTPKDLSTPERLSILLHDIEAILEELQPEVVAIERILFRSNAKTAMSVGQASGVILLAAFEAGCEIVEYSASEVKLAVAGYGSAEKIQVQRMVQVLAKLDEVPRPPDVADALGLAFCHIANHSFRSIIPASGRSEIG